MTRVTLSVNFQLPEYEIGFEAQTGRLSMGALVRLASAVVFIL